MRRPAGVTLLSAMVFVLSLLQWTRAVTLATRRPVLTGLGVSIPLTYAVVSAAVWGAVLLAACLGLWRMARWGRWLALASVTGSQAQMWLDRALFARSDYSRLSAGFALGATLAVLAVTWGLLWWPSVRKRFQIVDF